MSQSPLGNLHSELLDDGNQSSCPRFLDNNTRYSSPGDALFSHPGAEAGNSRASREFNFNGDWDTEVCLGESLAGLEIDAIDGCSNSELADSILDGTNDISIDASWSRRAPARVVSSEHANNPIHGAYNNLTASQSSKITSPYSPWQQLSSWPEGSSTNLCPPTYTAHRSSAATRSQHSDSAWETDASPSADDYDMRPMPDEHSASMQSYNDPQAGIWLQEGTYGLDPTYSIITDMRHDNGINSTVTQTLRPSLRQVLDDVDATMPTGTESYRSGVDTFPKPYTSADGRQEVAHPSLPMPSTGGSLVPQLSPNPFDGRSLVSTETNGTLNVGAFLVQQRLEVEHPFYALGSDQNIAHNISPMIIRDDTSLPATHMPHNRPTTRAAPVLTPSTSADASATGVAICPHRGCHKRFTGAKREDTLRRHKRLGHGNKPKPVCPVCGHLFESGRPDNLKRHIIGKHPGHPLPASRNVRTRESGPRRRVP